MTSTSGLSPSHGLSGQTSTTGLLDNHFTLESKNRWSVRKKTSIASGPDVPMDDNCDSDDDSDSEYSMDVAFFPS